MESKPKHIKISTPAVIFFSLLLTITSFYSGSMWIKAQTNGGTPSVKADKSTVVFAAEKNDKPEFKFYVMSFCPYGNQVEDVLRPVYDLLGDKAILQPQYIFDKVDNLDTYCQSRSGNPSQCATYVQNKYFNSEAECKKAIADNLSKCQDEKAYIKSPSGAMYASLHGRQEANQDVREICAWNQATDKKQWWDFVGEINKNCTAQNSDACWEEQAKRAGLDANKITECFNDEGIALIEKEIALTTKNNISGSPTLFVNGVTFPPESAYTQDNLGSLKLGKVIVNQDQYRTPNTLKEAICASFKNPPQECKTKLAQPANAAPAAGGC